MLGWKLPAASKRAAWAKQKHWKRRYRFNSRTRTSSSTNPPKMEHQFITKRCKPDCLFHTRPATYPLWICCLQHQLHSFNRVRSTRGFIHQATVSTNTIAGGMSKAILPRDYGERSVGSPERRPADSRFSTSSDKPHASSPCIFVRAFQEAAPRGDKQHKPTLPRTEGRGQLTKLI